MGLEITIRDVGGMSKQNLIEMCSMKAELGRISATARMLQKLRWFLLFVVTRKR